MTNKLGRSAQAFASRAKISGTTGLFVFVEGRIGDRSFYDRLLAKHPQASGIGYSIRLVEEVTLNGHSAGGKDHSCKLFDFFHMQNLLTQSNSLGTRKIVFMLDRDYDTFAGCQRTDPHVIYTRFADVEAEVLLNGALERAVSSAYHVTHEIACELVPSGMTLGTTLANNWREWITCRAISERHKVQVVDVRHGGLSAVNINTFGPVDSIAVAAIIDTLAAAMPSGSSDHMIAQVQREIEDIYSRDKQVFLVSGKWLMSYIHHLVYDCPHGHVIAGSISNDSVFTCALETLDFGDAWTSHFNSRLDAALSA